MIMTSFWNWDAYALNNLHIHLIRLKKWNELAFFLCDLEYLKVEAIHIRDSRKGFSFARFLGVCMNAIPQSTMQENQKLVNIFSDMNSFATCLEMTYCQVGKYHYQYRDNKATCKKCGYNSIFHGHVDLPHADYHDQYFSWCSTCFWSWAKDEYNSDYSFDSEIYDFDYSKNTY